jgi:valyl-tRNA synthetase
MPLASQYDAKLFELKTNQKWQELKLGNPETQAEIQRLGENPPTHTILMPPPNLTGALHAGHAFQHFLMDTLSRINRQKGRQNLWFPGVDHAGIQLEGVIDKLIGKGEFDDLLFRAGNLVGLKLKTINKEERAQFLKKNYPQTWLELAWTKVGQWRDNQKEQAKILGDTPDYSRQLFTLDDRATEMVMEAFKKYWQDGLIYKGAYMVNWSVGLQTALADVPGEIDYETRTDPFVNFEYEAKNWELNYDRKGFNGEILRDNLDDEGLKEILFVSQALKPCSQWKRLKLGTVRIETQFADVAVAMHPSKFENYFKIEDIFQTDSINFEQRTAKKFVDFIKRGLIEIFYHLPPLKGGDLKLVLSDKVDANFGTGILKITPGHDIFDYDLFQEMVRDGVLSSAVIQTCINRSGKLNEMAGEFEDLTIEQARGVIILKLIKSGYIPAKETLEEGVDKTFDKELEQKNKQESEKITDKNLLELSYPQVIHKLSTSYPQADIDWNYSHNVAICERSKTVVEPLISEEYFIDYYKEFSWKPACKKNKTLYQNVKFRNAGKEDLIKIIELKKEFEIGILKSVKTSDTNQPTKNEANFFEDKDYQIEEVEKWKGYLKDTNICIKVVKANTRVVGFAIGQIVLENREAVAELTDIYISKKYTSEEIVKSLVESLEDFLALKSKRLIRVAKINTTLINYFQRIGYAIICKIDYPIKIGKDQFFLEGYKMEYLGKEPVFDTRKTNELDLSWQQERKRAVALIEVENTGKFVVFRKPRSSLEYYDNPKYRFLPGGGIEQINDEYENPIQTAIRETLEELGITGLKHKQSLGVIRTLLRYQRQIANGLEYYELFSISMADFENRVESEAEKKHWQIELASIDELRQNGWSQLNYILDNYQYLGQKDLDDDLNTETTTLQQLGLRVMAKTQFYPEQYQQRAQNFLNNIKNWCISRNLLWGHRIPVWYRVDEGYNPEKKFYSYKDWKDDLVIRFEEDGTSVSVRQVFWVGFQKPSSEGNWVQEEKILDTWFSSCLWPLTTLDYLSFWQDKNLNGDFVNFYPTQEMITGKDIFYQWIVRMSLLSYYFTAQIPYKNLIINPTILDEQGRKMSKSLGNGLDPVKAVDKFSSDSLRLAMLGAMIPDRNVRMGGGLADKLMEKYRNFGNKLWNVGRFLEIKKLEYIQSLPNFEDLQISTQRLVLKALNIEYAHPLFELLTENIRKYFYEFTRIEQLQEWIQYSLSKMENKEKIELVITNKVSGDVLGLISLRNLVSNQPEFGLWVREDYQRQKVATEAILGLQNWAKENLQYQTLVYCTHQENNTSKLFAENLIEHMGGKYIGVVGDNKSVKEGDKPKNLVHRFDLAGSNWKSTPASDWILNKFRNLEQVLEQSLSTYEFAHSVDAIYQFLWDDLADWIVEYLKTDITQFPIILEVYKQFLVLIYPYIPFESVVLWQKLGFEDSFGNLEFIIKDSNWLSEFEINSAKVFEFEQIVKLILSLRSLRGLFNIDPARELEFYTTSHLPIKYKEFIKLVGRATIVSEQNLNLYQVNLDSFSCGVDIFSYIKDLDQEKKRTIKQIESLEKQILAIQNQLNNGAFLSKAEPEVVNEKKEQLSQRLQEKQSQESKLKVLEVG